ncbi:MAG: hypothetical protein Harvfovirus58_1, partial [Harvfovirus sp.]
APKVPNLQQQLAALSQRYGASATSPGSVFAPKSASALSDRASDASAAAYGDAKQFVDKLLTYGKNKVPPSEYSASMPSLLSDTGAFNTDQFLNDIIASKPVQQAATYLQTAIPQSSLIGGRSKLISGTRRMNLYSDFENMMGGSETSDDMRDVTGGLARETQSQVDLIHERTIKKIMEIMKVPEDIARNYKAVLYRRVKVERPELGGYDRAMAAGVFPFLSCICTNDFTSPLDKIFINKF